MSSSPIPSLSSSIAGSFAGVSKYATSLQSVLNRAVGIAALPLQSLNAGLTTLSERQSALQTLDASFLVLQQSVTSLQGILKSNTLSSSVSDGSIVSATVSSGALAGTYNIEVENLGSFSSAVSLAGPTTVTDPSATGITSATSLTLHTGTTTTTITPTSTSLASLVDAINSQASDQVQATLVNVGSTASPDYRLSLRAIKLGSDALDLTDSSVSLIGTSTAGTLASYKVEGLATSITSDSRTVTLAPGLTVNLLSKSSTGAATTITVANNATGIAAGLSSFARAYNNSVDAIARHRGENSGALRGSSLLLSLSGALGQLSSYSGGGPEASLAAFGVSLDKEGHLSVDSATLSAAASTRFPQLLTTLGSSSTGGFLKLATDLLGALEDPVTGLFKGEETTVAEAITTQKKKMVEQQTTVTNLQTNLTAQLAKADAAIARLESQVSYVTGLFAAYNGTKSSNV